MQPRKILCVPVGFSFVVAAVRCKVFARQGHKSSAPISELSQEKTRNAVVPNTRQSQFKAHRLFLRRACVTRFGNAAGAEAKTMHQIYLIRCISGPDQVVFRAGRSPHHPPPYAAEFGAQ